MANRTSDRVLEGYAPPAPSGTSPSPPHAPRTRRLARLLWAATALLVVLGVADALTRAVYVEDFGMRAAPIRERILTSLGRRDPLLPGRNADFKENDDKYARYAPVTRLHVLAGAAYLLLAPFQFSARIRRRYRGFHRWSGRALVVLGLLTGMAGLFFGLLHPFAGLAETLAVSIAGGLFLVALVRAFVAIRRRQVALHRVWMLRAFAVGVGISMARVVTLVFDPLFSPTGAATRPLFVLCITTGWAITVGAGELWLRRTRGLPIAA